MRIKSHPEAVQIMAAKHENGFQVKKIRRRTLTFCSAAEMKLFLRKPSECPVIEISATQRALGFQDHLAVESCHSWPDPYTHQSS